MEMNFKKIIGIVAFFVTPVVLAVLVMLEPELEVFNELGLAAIVALGITLFIRPLGIITGKEIFWKIGFFRKEFGVIVFWLFLFHGLGQIYMYFLGEQPIVGEFRTEMFVGIASGFILLFMFILSNSWLTDKFNINWGKMSPLSYIAFVFALVHSPVISGEYELPAILLVTFAVLKIVEFRKIQIYNKAKEQQGMNKPPSGA